MNPDLLLRFYAFLLTLFPRRYRDEFGAEMQGVFEQVIRAAGDSGDRALWLVWLRELRDLPRLALREHWLERKRPRYVPADEALPLEPDVPRWALWASAGIFLAPALLSLLGGWLPPIFGSILAILLGGGLLLAMFYGFFMGLPRWSLPFIGLIAGFIGVYGIWSLVTDAIHPTFYPLYLQLGESRELLPRLVWQFILAGTMWGCIGLVVAGFVLFLAQIPPARPLFHSLREDWTQVSFIFYGATLLGILLDFDEYRYEEPFLFALLLCMAGGAWGYLRLGTRTGRILALLGGVTLAMAVLGVAKFYLVPLQDWPVWSNEHSPFEERWFESLREIASWFWMVAALISPWLARRRPPAVANLALVGLWLLLFRPIYPYLQIIFTHQEFRLNQIALAGVIGLLIYQARRGGLHLRFSAPPALYVPALAMLLGSSAAFILAERLVDINTLSASLFGLAFYGLLGLWLEPRRWRYGLPAALLLIATLPFGEHLQTFVGYPLRMLTAMLVRDGLAAFGVHSVGIDTILVFENGISQVDLPCSGVKSLWTGGMFLLAATWIEGRRFHRRWFLAGLAFAILLLAANLARVAVLVTVGQVLGWRLLAEMLHVPLGVLGFAAACAVLVWMLRRYVPAEGAAAVPPRVELPRPRWLAPVLLASILGMALIYTPRPSVAAAQSSVPLVFPEGLSTEPWAFTPGEMDWLSADGPLSAGRWRFQWRGRTGSLLLITSDTWRAHHRPERCFESYGLTIDQSFSRLLNDDFPLRVIALSAARQRSQYTAVYWLQSPDRVTDDYATRIWSDLSPQHQTWVLVTILFDTTVDPLEKDLEGFYTGLRQSVDASLEGVNSR